VIRATLYRKSRFDELKRQWDLLAAHPGTLQFGRFRKSFLKRMWNAGEFMKTLKQHFTMSYNSRRAHAGTMWEGRYHEACGGDPDAIRGYDAVYGGHRLGWERRNGCRMSSTKGVTGWR